jgi:DNA helicase-2/ATP-dependent DNA helicase PcrA
LLDLSRLSPAQRQAVLAGDGPLLIVAGPGSGKTTVLAARIAHLILVRGVGPASVLAVTFTRAAAHELRHRLRGIIGELADAVEVTTLHALGFRIVRHWSDALEFRPGPLTVYGRADTHRLLAETVAKVGYDPTAERPLNLATTLERYRLAGETAAAPYPYPALAETYEALLRRRNGVDFPAMLLLPLRLFGDRPSALRLYQDAYRHLLCDEG